MSSHLHTSVAVFRDLQVQPLLAGVQTVNHLLVCQFPRSDREASQVTSEKLCHVQVTTLGRGGSKIMVRLAAHGLLVTCRGHVTSGGSLMDGHAS